LSVLLLKLRHFWCFWRKNPRFLSLFSVCLLTIQETTSNEINHLRVGGLQSVLVGLGDRERKLTRERVICDRSGTVLVHATSAVSNFGGY